MSYHSYVSADACVNVHYNGTFIHRFLMCKVSRQFILICKTPITSAAYVAARWFAAYVSHLMFDVIGGIAELLSTHHTDKKLFVCTR